MDMLTRDILRDFGIPTKTARLPWVLDVPKGEETYRIEVSKTDNTQSPWHADAYRKAGQSWKRVDLPWIDERHKEIAIRQALDFLGFSQSKLKQKP